ncbi:uncharacterized protein LOC113498796 [Trichoplusia ni]|uniref:Uncharacterized protein LOC113498796 n=1 Tax=Trichoplusia ni TaxID=7111 RepID=A0A7E5W2K1_TRINI|nr:uncharacterized protein LOC113498796 [Trichoplusia ni]
METQNFLFHIKNPKIKNILTNRLTTLLEELDAEETTPDANIKDIKTHKDPAKGTDADTTEKTAEDGTKQPQNDEDLLHLTMHNILLQGIIGHMDLNDVYKRVHTLMSNINLRDGKKDQNIKMDEMENLLTGNKASITKSAIEDKFLEELVNCNELQHQITEASTPQPKIESRKNIGVIKTPNVIIKTVIDITSIGDKAKEESKNQKDNIKGVIELVYNGKTIKFTTPDSDATNSIRKQKSNAVKPQVLKTIEIPNTKEDSDYKKIPKSYLKNFVEEYFKRFPQDKQISTEINEKYETKRMKRHIKIKYDNDDASKEKTKQKKKTEDDELYVEIETHFDSKGLKGEKKKKLIRSLIEKIQNAIHSDMDGKLISKTNGNKKKIKQLHVRKRTQNPLEHKDRVLVNKYTIPINDFERRQSNPITKTIKLHESSPLIGTRSGDDWRKSYSGPSFLTASKSINSGEMSEVDLDYSKVLDVNGIPQRLQKPLNTELSEETVSTNSYYDIGNMKFFIKDIDGSGFSIGFNQYVDEPPDPDTMKLFTGLENVIKTYHQNYDPADPVTTEAAPLIEEKAQDADQPNNEHIIVRRSVNKKRDYHSNEYKIIFDDNFLPYNNYRDIFESKKSDTDIEISKNQVKDMPLIVDENVFEKNLKPSEIFGLANLFQRKKRSINVKKISNLKSKIKLNRYLNTKAMSTKRIFLNKKRNKRQVNKIRIIATDMPHLTKNSDENIFVVSDENVFADRAIVKEVETAEIDHDKQEDTEYVPYQPEDNMPIPANYVTKLFDGRSRHNPLMAKYPHIFMEEVSRSREEYIPDNALLFGKIPGIGRIGPNMEPEKIEEIPTPEPPSAPPPIPTAADQSKSPKVQEIVNALAPSPTKTNYKVTVKIIPKNLTGLNSGFKEIHTSINKRFHKNGLMYSSLVNVSEISKVVKLNRSKDMIDFKPPDTVVARKIKDQQDKMQILLKQHARHINEQLSRLNEEKSNIESFLVDGDNGTDRFDEMDILPQAQAPVLAKPAKGIVSQLDNINQMTADAFKEMRTTLELTEPPTTTTMATTTEAQTFSEKLKHNIITTIEKNENLTDQILKKIDRNTEILQAFLKKLTEKIEQTPKPKEEESKSEQVNKFEANTFPEEWRNQGVQFNQNMVIRKNDSHISIPFVYAYQQPILSHKREPPVASVVYHGHIHTNTIHPKDIPISEEKDKVTAIHKVPETNQTRFFIDELENDYKVIQPSELVYRIQEEKDGSSIIITSPKLKKPTLREIIYYHIIERPYTKKNGKEGSSTDYQPTYEEIRRVFTNGPGFQYGRIKKNDLPNDGTGQIDIRHGDMSVSDQGNINFPLERASDKDNEAPKRRKRDTTIETSAFQRKKRESNIMSGLPNWPSTLYMNKQPAFTNLPNAIGDVNLTQNKDENQGMKVNGFPGFMPFGMGYTGNSGSLWNTQQMIVLITQRFDPDV